MFRRLFSVADTAIDAVGATFAPPADATSRQIRVNGALCIAAALGCLVAFGALAWGWHRLFPEYGPPSPKLVIVPAIAFYVLTMFGTYRLIVGKSPQPRYPGEISLKRVMFAIASILMVFATLVGIGFIADRLA
jgi:hypothetical protein